MRRFSLLTLLVSMWLTLSAANTKTTVDQVTGTVELTDDVDYHITSSEPFATTGSINFINTEHAVVFLDNLKPSKARNMLVFFKINGEDAIINKNCQIRIYNQGSLILPYGTAGALTVYSEKNFEGESCSDFNFNSSGGYMQTLKTSQLNNRIRSFKLKRGYMVTFAIGSEGRGYSRCFIADEEDLEVASLPSILSDRISSYRLFRWQNTSKKGVADYVTTNLTTVLNATWSYTWGTGKSLLPDAECVPHHIKENWPSPSELGSATYSCHIKTNNEPLNKSDDSPVNSVDDILVNWQDLMRTGMRLLTPSSWDGSDQWNGNGFIKQFLDSIDKRGWRCDVVDAHCYWPENNFGNLTTWFSNLKRPIWISEFVWGASWNNNGAFASGVTEAENKNAMARIWTRLNEMECVERYAYWNGERDPSKIYKNNKLTPAGEYFVEMNTGAGYKAKNEFIPRTPPVTNPRAATLRYTPRSGEGTLSWTDANGELVDSMFVEVKSEGNSWQRLATIEIKESNSSYSYKFTNSEPGNYVYRIHTIDYKGVEHYSSDVYNIITASDVLLENSIQVGTLNSASSMPCHNFYSESLATEPAVVFGSVSNNNSGLALVERLRSNNASDEVYTSLTCNIVPVEYGGTTDIKYSEYTSFIAASQGTGTIGSLPYEAVILPQQYVSDTVDYTFTQTFTEAPVVMATPIYTSDSYPLLWRVFDVTPTGCRIVLQRLAQVTSTNRLQARISLFAIAKGKATLDDGHLVIVGDSVCEFTTSTLPRQRIEWGDSVYAPKVLVQMQTFDRKVAANLRTKASDPDETYTTVRIQTDFSDKANNAVSSRNPFVERLGWIVVGSSTAIPEGIFTPKSTMRQLVAYPSVVTTTFGVRDDEATTASIFSSSGQHLQQVPLCEGQATIDITRLPAGIYIVRTDAHHSTKIIKK